MFRILLIINAFLFSSLLLPAQKTRAKEGSAQETGKTTRAPRKTGQAGAGETRGTLPTGKAVPLPEPVIEGKRLALVIGNSRYGDNLLPRAIDDARKMEKTLQTLGFQVTFQEQAEASTMREAISALASQVKANDVGLFYFSGLNAALAQENYLLPAGQAAAAEWPATCPPLSAWLQVLEEAKEGKFIVCLEAARQHPLLTDLKVEKPGFAPVAKVPANVCLWLPNQPEKPAEWKYQGISLFTDTLAHNLVPGINHRVLFERCKQDCAKACEAAPEIAQQPWMRDGLAQPILFKSALSTRFGQEEKTGAYEVFPLVGEPVASSERSARVRQKVRETFGPALLFDKQRKTAWMPKPEDANAWVKVRFARDVTIKGLRVFNGHQSEVEAFLGGAKVTKLNIATDAGEEEVKMIPRMGEITVNLSKAHVTRGIGLKIVEITLGAGEAEVARQVALSEIEFF